MINILLIEVSVNLRFDHSYTTDRNHKFHKKLEAAGFALDDREVVHPGRHYCRFIMLAEDKHLGRQYVEFINIKPGGTNIPIPGLSLASKSKLEPISKSLKRKNLKVNYYHRNYDWAKNNIDRLPGWNFVSFPKHKSGIYFWLTEYEKRASKSKKKKNPNGVNQVIALDVTLSRADLKFYTKILGRPKNNSFKMFCGTKMVYQVGKRSRINAIIVGSRNLKKMMSKYKWDYLTAFDGRPGVGIQNPSTKMWDLVICNSN